MGHLEKLNMHVGMLFADFYLAFNMVISKVLASKLHRLGKICRWTPDKIQNLKAWCSTNNLILNTRKTKEIVVDIKKTMRIDLSAVLINGMAVERVPSFKL